MEGPAAEVLGEGGAERVVVGGDVLGEGAEVEAGAAGWEGPLNVEDLEGPLAGLDGDLDLSKQARQAAARRGDGVVGELRRELQDPVAAERGEEVVVFAVKARREGDGLDALGDGAEADLRRALEVLVLPRAAGGAVFSSTRKTRLRSTAKGGSRP